MRTINVKAECGAADDWYYFSPWRHPGSAPVFDSCGMAGGHPPPAVGGHAGFGGVYINTSGAHLGMVGSALKPAPTSTPTVWRVGSTVEVTWAVEANHAGGYQYRLAPAAGPLTEAAFQEHPLDFVGQQGFRWAGGSAAGGSELFFNGTYVSGDAVVPRGSTWAQNPVSDTQVVLRPVSLNPPSQLPREGGFQPHCDDPSMCSGNRPAANGSLLIVDTVRVPANLEPGAWVLGWRWVSDHANTVVSPPKHSTDALLVAQGL